MPRKSTTKKGKGGRPPFEITPAICKKAERLAKKGNTEKQIAISLGIHQDTLINKKKQYSEFAEAIKKGQAQAIIEVENTLFNEAIDGNTIAMIFFLKNRNPGCWKDKQEVEHSGELGLADTLKKARERVTQPPAKSE